MGSLQTTHKWSNSDCNKYSGLHLRSTLRLKPEVQTANNEIQAHEANEMSVSYESYESYIRNINGRHGLVLHAGTASPPSGLFWSCFPVVRSTSVAERPGLETYVLSCARHNYLHFLGQNEGSNGYQRSEIPSSGKSWFRTS